MLLTSMTTPDWEVVMSLERVSALICERGNRTSHAAIVSRERGIPCAVGAVGALNLEDGDKITLDCSGGEARIFAGEIPFEVQEVELKEIPETITKVMVNIAPRSTRNVPVFLKNLGKTVPKCKAVLKRPLNKPPIIPLALRIAGYTAMLHKEPEKMSNRKAIIAPAIMPLTPKAYPNNDSLKNLKALK